MNGHVAGLRGAIHRLAVNSVRQPDGFCRLFDAALASPQFLAAKAGARRGVAAPPPRAQAAIPAAFATAKKFTVIDMAGDVAAPLPVPEVLVTSVTFS